VTGRESPREILREQLHRLLGLPKTGRPAGLRGCRRRNREAKETTGSGMWSTSAEHKRTGPAMGESSLGSA
jgi:hypothetical protein